jgi:hypothetical protein
VAAQKLPEGQKEDRQKEEVFLPMPLIMNSRMEVEGQVAKGTGS